VAVDPSVEFRFIEAPAFVEANLPEPIPDNFF
jgi:hypothetical protein